MLLQFITEPSIGPKDRRIIRSHVMKGKNAGKPRSARRASTHRCARSQATRSENCPETDELIELDLQHTLSLDRILWNELTLAAFPEHVNPETTKFVYHRAYTSGC